MVALTTAGQPCTRSLKKGESVRSSVAANAAGNWLAKMAITRRKRLIHPSKAVELGKGV